MKYRVRIGVALGVVCVSGLGLFGLWFSTVCSAELRGTPLPVLVTAFGVETEALHSHLDISESCSYKGVAYVRGTTGGTEVLAFESGIGTAAVVHATQQTLEHFSVGLLVFSGIAGGVSSEVPLGRTVVAAEWLALGTENTILLDPLLVAQAVLVPNVVQVESGATADYFVTDTSMLPQRVAVVDMESYYFAETAADAEVPYMIFRSVSDYADGAETERGFALAANASARAALAFVRTYKTQ